MRVPLLGKVPFLTERAVVGIKWNAVFSGELSGTKISDALTFVPTLLRAVVMSLRADASATTRSHVQFSDVTVNCCQQSVVG